MIFHLLGAKFEAFAEVVPVFELIAWTMNLPPPAQPNNAGINTPPLPNGKDLIWPIVVLVIIEICTGPSI